MRFTTHILSIIILALHYSTAIAVNNLALGDGVVYASAGSDGIIVLDGTTGAEKGVVPVPPGFNGIHDISVSADLLFALDGLDGFVGVFDISTPQDPTFIAGTTEAVSVGPFAGVSAGGGIMVVSGGIGEMSIFRYSNTGALTTLTNSINLGVGQPDVLLDNNGAYAYVSTDFSAITDGDGFGITTVDLNSPDISRPSIERIGILGAGFTGGVTPPANFPLESAISGNRLWVAHGGGLSILSLENPAKPELVTTLSLDFPAVNVDADDDEAVVVGGASTPAAARVDLGNNNVENIDLPEVDGAGPATSVVLSGGTVIIAAGPVIVCDDCITSASSGGSENGNAEPEGDNSESESGNGESEGGKGESGDGNAESDSGNGESDSASNVPANDSSGDDGDDSDICVEEGYLLSRGVERSALLHRGSKATVLCPGHGLPCGTPSHVIRFAGSYMTYKELCTALSTCRHDRKVVNGVSIRHARLLCRADDEYCVVPHVMRTGLEVERALIRVVHSWVIAK